MPALRKAAATTADTSASSVGRMRGPVWKSWIREPNALKIEATCTPVAPAPTTSIDGGTEVKPQASLWVFVNSKPGTESADIVDDFAYARKQPGIIQHRLAHAYSVFT